MSGRPQGAFSAWLALELVCLRNASRVAGLKRPTTRAPRINAARTLKQKTWRSSGRPRANPPMHPRIDKRLHNPYKVLYPKAVHQAQRLALTNAPPTVRAQKNINKP